MDNVSIPKAVSEVAKHLIMHYGENIIYLGQKDSCDIYMYKFPEDLRTGFPFIFLYDKREDYVDTITGFQAVDIISEFVKE